MRKDVKLGLAVGGVLLAVLVVYVLVVPGNNPNQVGATLENLDGSESQAAGGDLSGGDVAQGGDTVAAESTGSGANTQDQVAGDTASEQEARATGGATADASAGAQDGADRSADKPTGETAGGGWNWDALVNGTERVPSMAAGTDVPMNGNSVNGGGAVADGAAASNGATRGGATANGTSAIGDGASATSTGNGSNASQDAANDRLADATAAGSSQAPVRQNVLAGNGGGAGTVRNSDAAPTTPASSGGAGGGAGKHVVKLGDTYAKISLAAYGTSKHYARIEAANPGIDPTRLKPGQTITLPAIDAKPAAGGGVAAASAGDAALDPQKEYKVQPNDSLYTISLRLYGTADRVEKLYELNKPAIGDDMARVKVGMVLRLPEPPAPSTAAASSR